MESNNNINEEIENKKIIFKDKNTNTKECKKMFFDKINDDNSSSIQENINENINDENINKNIENKSINITIQSSSILSNLKNYFGNNITKNEFIFNSLNSSVISNFSLQKNDNNNNLNQVHNKNIKFNKKSLKNIEIGTSNINSTTNISSSEKPASRCTCKNSNCLKFYCECFANGKFCENCICVNCKNNLENKDLRLEKYSLIMSRNPKAREKINSKKRSWTCKCKNSNCSKKYCDCYQHGKFCTSKCRCVNCCNKNNGNINTKEKRIKRIRGINKQKMYLLMNKKYKKRKNIKNNANINNDKKKEDIFNKNENEKKIKDPLFNFYTPKKQRNNYDKNNFIYYQNESTNALTGKKEREKLFENKDKDKKRKDVYTKLKMDNV